MEFSNCVLKLKEEGKPEVTLFMFASSSDQKVCFQGTNGDNWRWKSGLERQEISVGSPEHWR